VRHLSIYIPGIDKHYPARGTLEGGLKLVEKLDRPPPLISDEAKMGRDTTLSQFYLGTVQVRLRNLCYNFSSIVADDCTGCCISDIEHNLPALISLSDYHDSLSRSEVPERMVYQVGSPPKLLLPDSFELPCLHGYFRLDLAKRDNLSTLDDWWLVDLYQSGEY
jgi:hypothetical protein